MPHHQAGLQERAPLVQSHAEATRSHQAPTQSDLKTTLHPSRCGGQRDEYCRHWPPPIQPAHSRVLTYQDRSVGG